MHLTSILGNTQKLDGGAMFGNVPKAMWSKWITPDDRNRISLSCRALLIQESGKNILLETGIGAFLNPSLRERYGVEEDRHILLDSLNKVGLSDKDIDIVILSHLHFDHAGGLLSSWSDDEAKHLLFPKANYLVSKAAWQRALQPHVRDKASFIPHLNQLLEKSGRLVIVDSEQNKLLGKHFRFIMTHGHTPGLMHTILKLNKDEGSIIFASDLIPGTHWVHLPVSMGYDRAPEMLIDEKKEMLELAVNENARLFYTHDPVVAMSRVVQCDSGKFITIDEMKEFERMEITHNKTMN